MQRQTLPTIIRMLARSYLTASTTTQVAKGAYQPTHIALMNAKKDTQHHNNTKNNFSTGQVIDAAEAERHLVSQMVNSFYDRIQKRLQRKINVHNDIDSVFCTYSEADFSEAEKFTLEEKLRNMQPEEIKKIAIREFNGEEAHPIFGKVEMLLGKKSDLVIDELLFRLQKQDHQGNFKLDCEIIGTLFSTQPMETRRKAANILIEKLNLELVKDANCRNDNNILSICKALGDLGETPFAYQDKIIRLLVDHLHLNPWNADNERLARLALTSIGSVAKSFTGENRKKCFSALINALDQDHSVLSIIAVNELKEIIRKISWENNIKQDMAYLTSALEPRIETHPSSPAYCKYIRAMEVYAYIPPKFIHKENTAIPQTTTSPLELTSSTSLQEGSMHFENSRQQSSSGSNKNTKPYVLTAIGIATLFGSFFYNSVKLKKAREERQRNEDDLNLRKSKFSLQEEQVRVAASWWAQYLPGVRKVSFDEIHGHSNSHSVQDTIYAALHAMNQDVNDNNQVSKEQYENFINILSQKIRAAKKIHHEWFCDIDCLYIRIGDGVTYGPPNIVNEALKEAKISDDGFGWFPYKTEMVLYEDGQIYVNGRLTYKGQPAVEKNKTEVIHNHIRKLGNKW